MLSLFGASPYVEGLIALGLHTPENLLRDTDLHEESAGGNRMGVSVRTRRVSSSVAAPSRVPHYPNETYTDTSSSPSWERAGITRLKSNLNGRLK